jgi:hypothetical protein
MSKNGMKISLDCPFKTGFCADISIDMLGGGGCVRAFLQGGHARSPRTNHAKAFTGWHSDTKFAGRSA